MDQSDLTNLVQRTADWLRGGYNPNSNGTEEQIASGLKKLDDKVRTGGAAGCGRRAGRAARAAGYGHADGGAGPCGPVARPDPEPATGTRQSAGPAQRASRDRKDSGRRGQGRRGAQQAKCRRTGRAARTGGNRGRGSEARGSRAGQSGQGGRGGQGQQQAGTGRWPEWAARESDRAGRAAGRRRRMAAARRATESEFANGRRVCEWAIAGRGRKHRRESECRYGRAAVQWHARSECAARGAESGGPAARDSAGYEANWASCGRRRRAIRRRRSRSTICRRRC